MPLITTPYALANSYVSIDEASVFLTERLYVEKWTAADPYPNAIGFTVASNLVIGTTTIPLSPGTGIFSAGTLVRIGSGQYKVKSATIEGATSLQLVTGLSTTISSGTSVERLSANTREAALIWATQILDRSFVWQGAPAATDQKLAWPRYGVVNRDGTPVTYTEVPEMLRRLTAEFGHYLMRADTSRLPRVIGTGLKRATLPGPLEAEIDPKNTVGLIPPYIIQQLVMYGEQVAGTRGFAFANLERR